MKPSLGGGVTSQMRGAQKLQTTQFNGIQESSQREDYGWARGRG